MKEIRLRFLPTLLLFVLALHTLTHGLILPEVESVSLHGYSLQQAAGIDSLTAADAGEQNGQDDFKPPKNSFVDYSTFLTPGFMLPAYLPNVSKLQFRETFQAPPQVYLELVVPPHPA